MRKMISLFTVFFFVGSMSLFSQDLDEVLENYFEVIGQESLVKYSTFISKGRMVQMGQEFPLTIYQKRPGKMRMEAMIQGTSFIQVFDGENGWSIMPWTGSLEPQDMGEDQIKSMKQTADIDGDLYNWEEKGHSLSLIGKEDMEGSPVYKLKLIKEDGDEYTYFIDAENYVILRLDAKVKVSGSEIEASSFFSNYKPVSDLIVPFSIEQKMNDQTVMQIVIDSYEVEKDIPDSMFEKPETSE